MTQVNTNTIRQLQSDVNGFRSLTRIHEHDFVGEKASIICSTCGLRYCEKNVVRAALSVAARINTFRLFLSF
jgi:hypothetical protein